VVWVVGEEVGGRGGGGGNWALIAKLNFPYIQVLLKHFNITLLFIITIENKSQLFHNK